MHNIYAGKANDSANTATRAVRHGKGLGFRV